MSEEYPDVVCPECGAKWDVEESEDLSQPVIEDGKFRRDEDFYMTCPECGEDLVVPVEWDPYYCEAVTVEQYERDSHCVAH